MGNKASTKRRKPTSVSQSPETVAQPHKHDDVESKQPPAPSAGIRSELGDFVLLVALYLLQGVPLGLVMGSVPFLLKSKLSFSDIALFSLSSYPYSLKEKLDCADSESVQAITGVFLMILSQSIDSYVSLDSSAPVPVTFLAITFAGLVFLCATQDIAVDGWALTLLSEENKAYASTAQTIGLNSGYFLSFTVFLALNSKEFCVKYLGLESEAILLGSYLAFWGAMFIVCDLWLIFVKKEDLEFHESEEEGIQVVYHQIFQVISLPNMKRLISMIMISKVGFAAHDSVTALKLLEKGFSKEDLALTVLIDFPIQIIVGYYVAKWSNGPKPLRPWLNAFYVRLIFSGMGMLIVKFVPSTITTSYFVFVICVSVLNSMLSTIMFVGIGSYFTKISDPKIGGTYMTLLNTINNLAGTWPKYFILHSVDQFTEAQCLVNNSTESLFKCTSDATKSQCVLEGGRCVIDSDGYYPVSAGCLLVGLVVLVFVVRPTVGFLEKVPDVAWRVSRDGGSDDGEKTKLAGSKDD
ncbi:hypothetical protein HDU83_001530 [Entophlyctis luteolus]|nr:hypothetical protein HDU83_001530 [Entophlyctis luteolus]